VALKMILSGGHAGTAELARFRTEAEAIARCSIPTSCRGFEVGEHDVAFLHLESRRRSWIANSRNRRCSARSAQLSPRWLAMQAAISNVIHRD